MWIELRRPSDTYQKIPEDFFGLLYSMNIFPGSAIKLINKKLDLNLRKVLLRDYYAVCLSFNQGVFNIFRAFRHYSVPHQKYKFLNEIITD